MSSGGSAQPSREPISSCRVSGVRNGAKAAGTRGDLGLRASSNRLAIVILSLFEVVMWHLVLEGCSALAGKLGMKQRGAGRPATKTALPAPYDGGPKPLDRESVLRDEL